eukprot:1142531-Pelagomonas_calceolata.AAC.2
MEPSGKRHWRVKEEDQKTRKHTLTEESRPGGTDTWVENIRGIRNVSILGWESTPVMLSGFFRSSLKDDKQIVSSKQDVET